MRGVELGRKRVRDLLTVLAKLNPADCLASEPAQITQSSGIPFNVGMKTTWKPSTKRSPELKPFGPYTVGHPEGRPQWRRSNVRRAPYRIGAIGAASRECGAWRAEQ